MEALRIFKNASLTFSAISINLLYQSNSLGEGIFDPGTSGKCILEPVQRIIEYSFFILIHKKKLQLSGMLTPEEFIVAGDQLVHACPTWSW